MHLHTHTYTLIYVYMCIYMYAHICTYIYRGFWGGLYVCTCVCCHMIHTQSPHCTEGAEDTQFGPGHDIHGAGALFSLGLLVFPT